MRCLLQGSNVTIPLRSRNSTTAISTTVSDDLLGQARTALPDLNDASLMDQALAALCAEHRAAEIDRSYQVFRDVPLDTEDECQPHLAPRSAERPQDAASVRGPRRRDGLPLTRVPLLIQA